MSMLKDVELKNLYAQYETINHIRARHYLTSNTDNYRKLKLWHVQALKNELRLGEWVPTAHGIGFDTNGVLIEGQHRLTAIAESCITATLLVCYNLPPESKNKHDTGCKRTLADFTGLNNAVLATIRVPFRAMGNFRNTALSYTFIKPYIDGQLGQLSKELFNICSSTCGIVGVGVRSGLIMSIMSDKITKEEGFELFKKVAQLRKNTKGVYLNKSIAERRQIESNLPVLLTSLIEKMHQGITPVYDDKTGQFVDATEVREQGSKIMFLAMQAFDNSVNTKEEFVSPNYAQVAEVLS